MNNSLSVLFITSEVYPFSKSGGLGDVLGILPLTLANMGVSTSVITPFYGRLLTADYQIRLIYENCPVGYPWSNITADIYQSDFCGVPVYFIDRPEYFDRKNYYCTYHGDYFDNCERFIFFSRASLSWARKIGDPFSIVHAHDWHSALVPAYLYYLRRNDMFWQRTSSIMTIHNLAFQGQYSARLFWDSGLPIEAWHMNGAEHYGSFNMLKAGIAYADMITTVSPTYAEEILTSEFGCGLEGILSRKSERLKGILNGVDYNVWDPSHDKYLPCVYDQENVNKKQISKKSLLFEMGFSLQYIFRPLMGFIGRLREQKGIDLLLQIIPDLMQLDVALVILGEGDLEIETELFNLMERYPGQLSVCIGYTEDKSHQIMAGTDIFLMPSRYEPCGLTQLYSLKYGTIPIATNVGGLKDTVIPYPDPECTGFTFEKLESNIFLSTIRQAISVWEKKDIWKKIQFRAMQQDFSWDRSARHYLRVYQESQNQYLFSFEKSGLWKL